MKILKNTTDSEISLKYLGISLGPDVSRTIETTDYLTLASASSIGELSPLINSGDIVVNNGSRDLSVGEALIFVMYPEGAATMMFDSSNNSFESNTVQEAIEEVGAGASPGFSFSRPGDTWWSTWLNKAGGVSSNRAGVTVFIDNPVITKVACSSENESTYDLTVYEHDGDEVNLTELGVVSVTAERTHIFEVNWATTKGKQLAARLTDGSATNLGVDLQLKGNS